MSYKNIALISSNKHRATVLKKELLSKCSYISEFQESKSKKYDLIIVLGGDGFMLRVMHNYLHLKTPFYGINCGTMGFLLNKPKKNIDSEKLFKDIQTSKSINIGYLDASIVDNNGDKYNSIAINEISLFRSTHQMAKIKIEVDGITRMGEFLGDGLLVSTVVGSGAYNFSVNGPILPLESGVLSLMPISPFRPKRWGGAILQDDSVIKLTAIDYKDRRIGLMSDYIEVENVKSVEIKKNNKQQIKILFNKNLQLEEKIIQEQFLVY